MRPVFNVRVYGLLFDDSGRVLVTDELRNGIKMTKFPGGGIESGEGFLDALKREFHEELKIEVIIDKLFYINDFFQPSAFHPTDHLLSAYYLVSSAQASQVPTVLKPFDFPHEKEGAQVFRWMESFEIHPEKFTFPVDKVVAEKLRTGT